MKSCITVERELRPCIVRGEKALFHGWEDKREIHNAVLKGDVSGVLARTFAIVEYNDGVVTECYPHEIKFLDNKFREYDFREAKKMTERDRLIELIEREIDVKNAGINVEWLSDYLLANGVIVPPCKAGDIIKELTDRLARELNFEDNAVIMVTAEKDSDGEYKYSSFMQGKNKLCREAIVMLMFDVIDSEDGDLTSQLALIRYFEYALKAKKEEITEIAKFEEDNDGRD